MLSITADYTWIASISIEVRGIALKASRELLHCRERAETVVDQALLARVVTKTQALLRYLHEHWVGSEAQGYDPIGHIEHVFLKRSAEVRDFATAEKFGDRLGDSRLAT